MKRRSFLASIVAGVIAPFLPRGEAEAREVFVPDTTGQSDMATVFEFPEEEMDWGIERGVSKSIIAQWVETFDQCDCDINAEVREECESDSEIVDYLFTSDPRCPGGTLVFQVREDGKLRPW